MTGICFGVPVEQGIDVTELFVLLRDLAPLTPEAKLPEAGEMLGNLRTTNDAS